MALLRIAGQIPRTFGNGLKSTAILGMSLRFYSTAGESEWYFNKRKGLIMDFKAVCDALAKQLVEGTYTGVHEVDAKQISALIEQEITTYYFRTARSPSLRRDRIMKQQHEMKGAV